MPFIALIVGLAAVLIGGDFFVRSSIGFANRLGVPPLLIGLTIVALGTSAPELAVNVTAAIDGHTDVSFGNIVGSNIANLALVLAIACLVRPINGVQSAARRESPMVLAATLTSVFLVAEGWVSDGDPGYTRVDGLVLLTLCGLFVFVSIVRCRNHKPPAEEGGAASPSAWGTSILFALGLTGLIGGSEITVTAAAYLAQSIGISEALIGLTVVAIGTSLPELAATILATLRGEGQLAFGSIVGSNILNLALVMGTTAVVHPVGVPRGGLSDLLFMTVITAWVCLLAWRRGALGRPEGMFLFICYVLFLATRASTEF